MSSTPRENITLSDGTKAPLYPATNGVPWYAALAAFAAGGLLLWRSTRRASGHRAAAPRGDGAPVGPAGAAPPATQERAPQREGQENSETHTTPGPKGKDHETGGWWRVMKLTFIDFNSDNVFQLAAALAYYVLFSIAPVLLVVTVIAGAIYGRQAVTGELYGELERYVGPEGATLLQEMVAGAQQRRGAGTVASVIAIMMLLIGATAVMGQLKASLNTIWDVKPPSYLGRFNIVRDRLLALAMVLCIGILLLALVIINAVITMAQAWIEQWIGWPDWAVRVANNFGSLIVIMLLFAIMFRYLPDARVGWRHALLGAAVTAVLFALGQQVFGWYLERAAIATTYGAAGSVVVVLLWAYYGSLILFLGAEFTQAHSRVFGTPIRQQKSIW